MPAPASAVTASDYTGRRMGLSRWVWVLVSATAIMVIPWMNSYDYPYGYGEYAEYGPWAYRGYGYAGGGCQLTQRRVWTAYGLRWRTVRICN